MKLWIFVLLGLLPQTSHGHVVIPHETIARELEGALTSAIHGCKGSSFIFSLLKINGLELNILEVLSVSAAVQHIGGGQYRAVITASISAGCKGFSIPTLSAKIELTIKHGLKYGSPCHEIVTGSLKISITTNGKTEVIDTSLGGLVSGLLGLIVSVADLVASLLSTVTSILIGIITKEIEFCLKTLNDKFLLLTNTGENVHCTVTEIAYGAAGVGYSFLYEAKSTGKTISSIASQTITDLGAGVRSVLSISGDLSNFILGSSFSSYKKFIKGETFHLLKLFGGVDGDFDLSITPSSSHCTTSSEGAVLSVILELKLKDPAGVLVLELEAIADLRFKIVRSKGRYIIKIYESTIVKVTVKSRHASCGCDDDDTHIGSFIDLITGPINQIVSEVKCEHKHTPIPGSGYYGYSGEEDYECPCDNDGFYCTS